MGYYWCFFCRPMVYCLHLSKSDLIPLFKYFHFVVFLLGWQVNLYRGFLNICQPGEQHLNTVERHVENASALCMREWRRLPHIVSHAHLPLLRAAQQIMELSEAAQIHQVIS